MYTHVAWSFFLSMCYNIVCVHKCSNNCKEKEAFKGLATSEGRRKTGGRKSSAYIHVYRVQCKPGAVLHSVTVH